ncbi:UNVERIFIED_CONTAM: hypothetical protein NCL1_31415 [Trichonephila clavipes]
MSHTMFWVSYTTLTTADRGNSFSDSPSYNLIQKLCLAGVTRKIKIAAGIIHGTQFQIMIQY